MTSEHRSDAGPLPGETADPALTSALAAAHRAADAARPAILSLFRAEGLAAEETGWDELFALPREQKLSDQPPP